MRAPLAAFVRASTLHIGAAAATAALRDELVAQRRLDAGDVDAAYAVSRLTPGTNLLALYAQLGHRLGGWPLALGAPRPWLAPVRAVWRCSSAPRSAWRSRT